MADENETTSNGTSIKPCSLCHKDAGRYTCPRCNVRYCSVDCYKCEAHGDCSEAFYKSCVMTALQEMKSGDEEKERMLEMLKRLEQENPTLTTEDDVPEDEADLAERLDGVNLDQDCNEIWGALSLAEKTEFKQMLQDGRLGNMLTPWKPWWSEKVKSELVTDVEDDSTALPPRIPALLSDVPHISELLPKGCPAPSLQYNLVNVLFGYVYVCRFYNGVHMENCDQSAQDLLEMSGALLRGNYQSVLEAVVSCKECARKQGSQLSLSEEFSVSILNDARTIIAGYSASFILAALSDLHRIFKGARKSVEKDLKGVKIHAKDVERLKKDKQRLHAVQKKIEFLLSWAHSPNTDLRNLITETEIELCGMSSELAEHAQHKHTIEKTWKGTMPPARTAAPLIQEIPNT